MTIDSQRRIEFLDYMRIFAFLSVLLSHKFSDQLADLASDPSKHATFRALADGVSSVCLGGASGVVIFFFTSGYIITHVLQREAVAPFLVRRFFRIYPLYVVAVTCEAMFRYRDGLGFPPLSTIVPQLLLIGDLFNTPYTLAGVEWTLRIEIVFYLFMAALKYAGLLTSPRHLPAIFIGIALGLFFLPPLPSLNGWSQGYFSIYGPFLFVGSIFYLVEHAMTTRETAILSVALILFLFLSAIERIHPTWRTSHYAVFSLALFFLAWRYRTHLIGTPLTRLLSDMTYAVYLFHNWLWKYLQEAVARIGIDIVPAWAQIILLLFIVCDLAHRTVEKFGIYLGRTITQKYGTRNTSAMSVSEARTS